MADQRDLRKRALRHARLPGARSAALPSTQPSTRPPCFGLIDSAQRSGTVSRRSKPAQDPACAHRETHINISLCLSKAGKWRDRSPFRKRWASCARPPRRRACASWRCSSRASFRSPTSPTSSASRSRGSRAISSSWSRRVWSSATARAPGPSSGCPRRRAGLADPLLSGLDRTGAAPVGGSRPARRRPDAAGRDRPNLLRPPRAQVGRAALAARARGDRRGCGARRPGRAARSAA